MKPQMGIWFMAIHSMMKGMLVLGISIPVKGLIAISQDGHTIQF
jgi:hypothetical protein